MYLTQPMDGDIVLLLLRNNVVLMMSKVLNYKNDGMKFFSVK